jgi:demethoxyubiquinone hydroxylase (CLK1/Coq7/Cat5 family)
MPITPYLESHRFDPETKRVMGIAFEMARVALRLSDRTDVASKIIATRIIQLAQAGERDADQLCEGAMAFLREQQGQRGSQPVPPLPGSD